jgi:hypothetical protein
LWYNLTSCVLLLCAMACFHKLQEVIVVVGCLCFLSHWKHACIPIHNSIPPLSHAYCSMSNTQWLTNIRANGAMRLAAKSITIARAMSLRWKALSTAVHTRARSSSKVTGRAAGQQTANLLSVHQMWWKLERVSWLYINDVQILQ